MFKKLTRNYKRSLPEPRPTSCDAFTIVALVVDAIIDTPKRDYQSHPSWSCGCAIIERVIVWLGDRKLEIAAGPVPRTCSNGDRFLYNANVQSLSAL